MEATNRIAHDPASPVLGSGIARKTTPEIKTLDEFNGWLRSPAFNFYEARDILLARPDTERGAWSEASVAAVAVRKAEQDRQSDLDYRKRLWANFIEAAGNRYASATLDSFVITADQKLASRQRAVVSALRKYLVELPAHVKAGRGVWLHGPAGSGKDFLLAALARVAVKEHRLAVGFTTGPGLALRLRGAMNNKGESEIDIVGELSAVDLLVLSDPTPPSGGLSDYQSAAFYNILDTRYRRCRPTWVAINAASQSEADERLTAPITDRLMHGSVVCHCNWPSKGYPLDWRCHNM